MTPDSYVVRLLDGRVFRWTRRYINIDNSAAASFGIPPPSVIREALPNLSFPPPAAPPVNPVALTAAHWELPPRSEAPAAMPPSTSVVACRT